MNNLVAIKDGEVRASSQDVAAAFDKVHRDVLRAIDKLVETAPELTVRNFAHSQMKSPGKHGRTVRCYEMDRDGFSLLAMGFTGAKALEWKLKFLDAFRRMEEALSRSLAANDDLPPHRNGEDLERLRASIKLVELAQKLCGTEAALRVWRAEGLPPSIAARETPALLGTGWGVLPVIRDWADERIEEDQGARIPTPALYDDFIAFCADRGGEPVSKKVFAGQLTRLGFAALKSNGSWRLGARLRERVHESVGA